MHLLTIGNHVGDRANFQLHSFPLRFGPECVCERSLFHGNLRLVLLDAILGVIIPYETHWKFILLQKV